MNRFMRKVLVYNSLWFFVNWLKYATIVITEKIILTGSFNICCVPRMKPRRVTSILIKSLQVKNLKSLGSTNVHFNCTSERDSARARRREIRTLLSLFIYQHDICENLSQLFRRLAFVSCFTRMRFRYCSFDTGFGKLSISLTAIKEESIEINRMIFWWWQINASRVSNSRNFINQ